MAVLSSRAHERRARAAKPREKEKPPARIRGVFDCRPLHLILTPGVTTCLVSISPANHRLDSNMKLRAKVWRVWQEIKTNPHALSSFSMGTKGDTPKKPANVQRAISSVNDNCRLCCCPLKIKYGEFKKNSYISTQNLFKVSKREGCIQGLTLAELCSHIGLEIEKSDTFSDRVCHACGRKIRNAFDFYTFIASNLKREKDNSAVMEVDDHSGRFKRLLPTTISSPDRSPQARKGKKATRQKSSAKKSLSFKDVSSSVVNTDSHHNEMSSSNTADDSPQAVGELFLSYLNVEDLLESSSTEAKVVIVNPGGRVETFSSFHDKTKSIMVNLCRKKWKTVANLTFEHPNIREELPDPLRRTVSKEFQEYCNNATDSVLKKSRPDYLAAFSNKVLVHEADVWCPFWMNCVRGACNVRDSSQLDVKKINAMALITSVAARGRNETMSAVAYRISAVLFHSGVKHEDLRILNKLGVCMSPDMIVQFQRKMGECCESKVGHWKREIEKAKVASLLLNEVREKQVLQLLPPQSPRGFSALARLYYLATKTTMLRRLSLVRFFLDCF